MKLLLLTLLSFCGPAIADDARDAAWRLDLDYPAAQLPQVRNAIPPLPDAGVMVGMAGIVALAGDGHTNLWLTDPRALGARVTRIGARTVDEAYQAVAATISHENDIWVRETSPDYLINADVLGALQIAPASDSVTFELEDSGGVFQVDVPSLDPGTATSMTVAPDGAAGFTPLYQQHRDLNYWFTYVESSRTLYFAYNVCEQMAGTPFAQFNDQFWAVVDSRPVERLIIDLRNNSGGDSSVLSPFLLSGAMRADRFPAARGYVIIGGRTFSSAILNTINMKQGPVTVVGQPTGGSPNSYGEVKTLTLPNCGLAVNYSTRYFSFPDYPAGSMLPDVTVPFYSSDYFASRHDPFLAAVLADAPPSPDPVAAAIGISAAPLDAGGRTFQVAVSGPGTDDTSAIPRVYVGNDLAPVYYSGPGLLTVGIPGGTALQGEVPLFATPGTAFSNPVAVRVGN